MIRQITAPDDSGNIIVHEVSRNIATLSIRPDKAGGWAQWFYFEVSGTPDTCCELRIIDAGDCSYPEGWVDYRVCVSEDGAWTRTETDYDGKTLTIRHRLVSGEAKFAYFEPYPLSRHRDQMRRIGDRWPVNTLGISLGGNSIDRIRIGHGGFQIWLLGRQHSGETMASWWMDGALDQLEAEADLLEQATIHIVPLVNPDGACRGNLRGNAAGVDLNRQWRDPDPDLAPEVMCILEAMQSSGVDFCIDVHGDEALPHVFIDGCEKISAPTNFQLSGLARFKSLLLQNSKSFQTRVGYAADYGGPAADGMAARAVAARFGAIAMTLEMPFKDSLESPDPRHGWTARASKLLGMHCVESLATFVSSHCEQS